LAILLPTASISTSHYLNHLSYSIKGSHISITVAYNYAHSLSIYQLIF